MMRRSEELFAYASFAVAGLLVGLGLSVLSGTAAVQRWVPTPAALEANQVRLAGTVEGAGWRSSARGAERFLQIRLRDDPRDFLVVASDVPKAVREWLGRTDRLSRLEGGRAVIVTAARFQERPRPPTPYMLALHVDGTVIVPHGRAADPPPPWQRTVVSILLGAGLLVGLALVGVSGHHLVLCIRAWRRP